ncbi:MAG: sigma-70 family RNA polymerase sigma factor, partial [Nocardioides sp.]|uniref:sigma-70 family RNA polymerase sigma factor n=1 Tax=Nocardioides sp. TaxID=35761 RepID=UPI003267D1B0
MDPESLTVGRVPGLRDGPTLRDVFDASYRKLVVQMYGVTGSMDEAEDLVQESFVRAAAIGRRFRAVENPEAWLRTTAINAHRSRWRKLRNGRRAQDRMLGPSDPQGIDDHLTLVAALRTLPEDQRVAIALHHLADLPVAQVADELGVPIGAIERRGARRRFTRRAAGTVAVAAVLATVGSLAFRTDGPAPSPGPAVDPGLTGYPLIEETSDGRIPPGRSELPALTRSSPDAAVTVLIPDTARGWGESIDHSGTYST